MITLLERCIQKLYVQTVFCFSTGCFVWGGLFVWIWTLWFPMCAYRKRSVLTFLKSALSLMKYISVPCRVCHTQYTCCSNIHCSPESYYRKRNKSKTVTTLVFQSKWQFENNLKWIRIKNWTIFIDYKAETFRRMPMIQIMQALKSLLLLLREEEFVLLSLFM